MTKKDNLNPLEFETVGTVVTYTITATNESAKVTLHEVTVSDSPALAGFKCTPAIPVAELAPGKSITCTGTHTITQEDLDIGFFKDSRERDEQRGQRPARRRHDHRQTEPEAGADQDRQPETGQVQQSRPGRDLHADGDQRRQHHAART